MTLKLVGNAISHIGEVRSSNQDSGYSGYSLFLVADGMGGHAGGDFASALVTQRLAQIDATYAGTDEAESMLVAGVREANAMLVKTVESHPILAGMGTTLSSALFVGDKVVIGHIGDSRIYLARDGKVRQITVDHTFVQRLVETGKITPEEALVHPRRNVLMRVLGDGIENPEIDTMVLDVKPGDRWLACSDGLCGYVSDKLIGESMLAKVEGSKILEDLVFEAREQGAPDNVTAVVVDVVASMDALTELAKPVFVGSAENEVVIENSKGRRMLRLVNPKTYADMILGLGREVDPSEYMSDTDEGWETFNRLSQKMKRGRWLRQAATMLFLVAVAAGLVAGVYQYSQARYYVAEYQGHVAIFKGIRESFGPFKFSSLYRETGISVTDLSDFQQQLLEHSVYATDVADANRIVNQVFEVANHG
ncbi:MAG: hypothetical protein RLZZ626_299 [Actinomycetota bacterium]